MWCALSWFFIHYYQSTWRFPRGPSFIKSPRKKSVSSVITSAWYLWGQGTDHPGKLMHRESSNFSSDSELGITMQEWESGIRIESAMKIPNHCSATVKKQKQLQGITGNGAQGWNHYCQHFNSQHKRTGRKGKKDDNIYERQLNTKTLPPAQGSTKLWITGNQVSFLEQKWATALLFHLCAIYQSWKHNIGKKNLSLTWRVLSFLLSHLFFQSWSFKNCIATPNEGKDSSDTLGDPSRHPLKPGERTHRKWI